MMVTRGARGATAATRAQPGSRRPCATPQGDVGEKGPEGAPGKDGARVSGTGTGREGARQGRSWWPARDTHGGHPRTLMVASQGYPWWPARDVLGGQPGTLMVASQSSPWWPSRGVPGGLLLMAVREGCPWWPLRPLVASLSPLSPQGLTGPIGPPGPAGPNGEKVRPGWPHQCSHRGRSHLNPGVEPTRSLGQIPPDPQGRSYSIPGADSNQSPRADP